jgi:hypothetical protein
LARLKVEWNQYLFKTVLPKAWAKFLRELPFKVSNVQPKNVHKFWPIIDGNKKSTLTSIFYKDLLQNVVSNLNTDDHVFRGPSISNTIGALNGIPKKSYNKSLFQKSEFYWLSIYNGYLEDNGFFIYEIIESIGFPIILIPPSIIEALKNSRHKGSLKLLSPTIIRDYLSRNRDRWEHDAIEKNKVLQLFQYILQEEQFSLLEGFKMIPLADGTLGTLTRSRNSNVYLTDHRNDEQHIFTEHLHKFVDKSIDHELYARLYKNAKSGWNLNIKILDESAVADLIKSSLNYESNRNNEEIPIQNNWEWIRKLWDNLICRDWDLRIFEDIHLIPTRHHTLRKLKTPRKIFSSKIGYIPIFEKFGIAFVDNKFDTEWHK